jgi:Sec-independent protein translocase protein TatA
LPKLARSLGSASHEFKSASEEFKKASDEGVAITVIHAPPAVPTVTPPAGDANGTESHPSPFS